MIPLITKQQLSSATAMPDSVKDNEAEGYIRDAQENELIPVLPDLLLRAIAVQVLSKLQQWNKNKAYITGDKVFFSKPAEGISKWYYKATANNTDSQPPSVNWGDFELMNFYEGYIVPYHALCAYYRFLAYHGVNINQYGLNVPTDPEGTFQPASDGQRSAILGDIRNRMNVAKARMTKKLSEVSNTFDGTLYTTDSGDSKNQKIKPKIFGLGNKSNDCSWPYR